MYTCAEMTSSEIASLNLVVDAKNVKTFCTMKRLCKQRWSTIPPISKTRTMTSHSAAIGIWLFTELRLMLELPRIKLELPKLKLSVLRIKKVLQVIKLELSRVKLYYQD
jgi:hypothetical protein